jgi:hypothetical protein
MPPVFKKGDRVFHRHKKGTVEKSVGGTDYVIRLDTGKRFVVDGRKLVQFEEIDDATPVSQADLPAEPDNATETVEPSAESQEDGTDEEESGEASGEDKPMLSRKKFEAMSKKELYNLAQLYEVPGRSGMSIDELRSSVGAKLDLQD